MRIEFDECPLLLRGTHIGYLYEGYVTLDQRGEIESMTLLNLGPNAGPDLTATYSNTGLVLWEYYLESIEDHLSEQLADARAAWDGWTDFDPNREYGTLNARAL